MLNKISLRFWYLGVAAACAALLGFALWVQHRDFLDPCPLCIIQRLAFMWIGAFALLAALHNPARIGQRIYSWLLIIGSMLGAGVSWWHVHLQGLPPDQVPECGPGLNYMLENFPLMETLKSVFFASGSCAEIKWQFLGLSMPGWTLVWFVGLTVLTLYFTYRKA